MNTFNCFVRVVAGVALLLVSLATTTLSFMPRVARALTPRASANATATFDPNDYVQFYACWPTGLPQVCPVGCDWNLFEIYCEPTYNFEDFCSLATDPCDIGLGCDVNSCRVVTPQDLGLGRSITRSILHDEDAAGERLPSVGTTTPLLARVLKLRP